MSAPTSPPPSMSPRLDGKCCVVTGGGGGIGAAACKKFVQEGAKGVVVADIKMEAAEETAKEINEEFPGKAVAIMVDVSKPEGAKATVDACVKHFGRLDVYFANAGILGKYLVRSLFLLFNNSANKKWIL